MGTIKTTNIETITGSGTLTLGQSGETISIPTNTTLGASGSTITIPSGCTITNNGTQTGFGGANTPAFEAKLSGSQTVSNGANTKIQLANEIFDTDNCFDNTTNYRFTPNVAGKYFVYVKANAESSNQEMTRLNVYIFKNGSYSEYTDIMSRDSNYFRIASGFYSKIVEMNGTTDYLEAYCYVTGGGTLGLLTNNSHFGAYKIIE